MAGQRVRVGSIVFNCRDFGRMTEFWCAALGYRPRGPLPPGETFTVLKDPAAKGPNVSIDQGEPERHMLHLDLYTDDQGGEVARLLKLGAKPYRPKEPGEDFVVLEDPEGNLFCVVDVNYTPPAPG